MGARIITDNQTLFLRYQELQAGDVVVGRIRLRPGEESLLVDLVSRGVHLVPSATAQLCSRSKVLQARLLGDFMGPGTSAVYDLHDMLRLFGEYDGGKVICKLDRANAGTGILCFSSMEDVYNQAVLGSLAFPFVVQPFYADCRDIRVVLLDDVVEAYERHNPKNFRHNLHCGGVSRPWPLTEKQRQLCLRVMRRADFPYAHIDFLVSATGETWLTEINLRGGLKGASLNQADYLTLVEQVHRKMVAALTGEATG
jgi:ribosomal protein S6--L-glutamate ligase